MGWMFATIGIILLMIFLMLFLYLKTREFIPILFVYCFSLLLGVISFSVSRIPFTPYIQIFFMLFQTIIFYLVCTKTNFTEVLKKGVD